MTINSDNYTGEEYLYDELGVRKPEANWLEANQDLPIVRELLNEVRMYDNFRNGLKIEGSYYRVVLFRIECHKQLSELENKQE